MQQASLHGRAGWSVHAAGVGYSLSRIVSVEGHLVRIKDQITTNGNQTTAAGYLPTGYVGIEITHRTAFVGGAGRMHGAVLPGTQVNPQLTRF